MLPCLVVPDLRKGDMYFCPECSKRTDEPGQCDGVDCDCIVVPCDSHVVPIGEPAIHLQFGADWSAGVTVHNLNTLCDPLAETTSARLANSWPRTSVKSTG